MYIYILCCHGQQGLIDSHGGEVCVFLHLSWDNDLIEPTERLRVQKVKEGLHIAILIYKFTPQFSHATSDTSVLQQD